MDGEATGRDAELACDCGYVARGADDDELVAAVQAHAWDVHGMALSAELILAIARSNGATVRGVGPEPEPDPGVRPSAERGLR
jgi:predicted small metal-binding protein